MFQIIKKKEANILDLTIFSIREGTSKTNTI